MSQYASIITDLNAGFSRHETAARHGIKISTVQSYLSVPKEPMRGLGPAKPIYEKKIFVKCRRCGKNAWPNRFFCHDCHEDFRISGRHAISKKHAATLQKKTPEIPDPTWPEEIAELPAEYWEV